MGGFFITAAFVISLIAKPTKKCGTFSGYLRQRLHAGYLRG